MFGFVSHKMKNQYSCGMTCVFLRSYILHTNRIEMAIVSHAHIEISMNKVVVNRLATNNFNIMQKDTWMLTSDKE